MAATTAGNEIGGFAEFDIEFRNEWLLRGTLTQLGGSGSYPAAILIPGSGDPDRDGTIKSLNLQTNIQKDLAICSQTLDW